MSERNHVSRGVYVLLAVVVLIALAVRMMRGTEGLPYLHHWDEPQVASSALRMMKAGDLDPRFLRYGSVTIYMNLLVDVVHYLYLMGRPEDAPASIKSLDEIKTRYDTDWEWTISHPSFYLWGRWLAAALGTASALLCFGLARRMGGLWAGLLAAALLAGLEIHILHSSIIGPDLPASFLVLGAVVLSFLYVERRQPAWLVGSLIACGLAASTKYNAVLSVIVPFLALSLAASSRSSGYKPWLWVALPLIPAVAFVIGTPYAVLHLPSFLSASAFELRHYRTGHEGATIEPGVTHLLYQIGQVGRNLGPLAAGFALAGLAALAVRKAGWLLLAYPAASLLFMSGMKVSFHRNLLSLYPFAAVAFGCGAAALSGLVSRGTRSVNGPGSTVWRWGRGARAAPLAIAAGVCAFALAAAVPRAVNVWKSPETRSRMVDRINALLESHDAKEARVGIEEELRVHQQDLRRLKARYEVRPYKDLICETSRPYDLIAAAKRHDSFSGADAERARFLNGLLPADMKIVETVEGEGALRLDIFSKNPAVLLIDPSSAPGLIPLACGKRL